MLGFSPSGETVQSDLLTSLSEILIALSDIYEGNFSEIYHQSFSNPFLLLPVFHRRSDLYRDGYGGVV